MASEKFPPLPLTKHSPSGGSFCSPEITALFKVESMLISSSAPD